MKPRITVITIGVEDMEKSLKFYRNGLGLPTRGIMGNAASDDAVAFFDLQAGIKLAILPKKRIFSDAGLPDSPAAPSGFTLGHDVYTRQEVDEVMTQAQVAGASIVKEAGKTLWGGYTGYFQDPDGYLWEISWNPQM